MADEIKEKLQSTVAPEITPVPTVSDPLGASTETPEDNPSTAGADADKAPEPVVEESKDETTEPTVDPDAPFVWDGGVENLPKELQDRGKGMLDHMHKVSQEAAEVKREADAYNQLTNHPEFQDFLKWQENK